MENLTYINSKSGVNHVISFTEPNHSLGKININCDGRNVGQINKKSKVIICNNEDIARIVREAIK